MTKVKVSLRSEDVRRLNAAGLFDSQIAAELGVSISAVRRCRRDLGLACNDPRRVFSDAQIDEISDLAESGHCAREIAEIKGFDVLQVRRQCDKRGIELPRDPKYRPWREEEDDLLIVGILSGRMQTEMAKDLRRTAFSVHARVTHLRDIGTLPARAGAEPPAAPECPALRAVPEVTLRRVTVRAPADDGLLDRLSERHGAALVRDLSGLPKRETYAALARVAARHRVPIARATQIWHQVRS